MKYRGVKKIGKPAAALSAFFAIVYSVVQLLAAFKMIPHPRELFWLFLPSLFLAYTFLITMICLHYLVPDEYNVYTGISCAFAILYCAFVSIVYFTQLAVFIPLLSQGKADETHVLAFTERSFLVAVDCIGYTAMNAATLFAAFAFRDDTKNKWLFRTFLLNGLLAPAVILAFFIPAFLYIGALWMITLPAAMVNATKTFTRRTENKQTPRYETAVA